MPTSTTSRRYLRLIVSALVALFVTVAPLLALYFGTGTGPRDYTAGEFLFLYLPLVIGSFVFTTLERSRPEWLHGVAFGFGVAVAGISALLVPALLPDIPESAVDPPSVGSMVTLGLMFLVLGALLGMAGSGVAVLVSRPLFLERPGHRPKRIKPWQVGAVVAAAELAVVGVLVASSG